MYASCIELLSICFFAVPTHGITFVEVVKKGVDVTTSFFLYSGAVKFLDYFPKSSEMADVLIINILFDQMCAC